MKKSSALPIVLSIISVCLAVVSYFILPDKVITQFSVNSSDNSTTPKLLAIFLPIALGVGGSVCALIFKGDEKSRNKGILVSVVGVILFIVMIVVNSLIK